MSARAFMAGLAACSAAALSACVGVGHYLSPCAHDRTGIECRDRSIPEAGGGNVAVSLFLVGDAGAGDQEEMTPDPRSLVLRHLKADLESETVPDRRLVYLGDNVYPNGLRDAGRDGCRTGGTSTASRYCPEDRMQLEAQIRAVPASGVTTYFLAGNHDWASTTSRRGYETLRNQERYFEDRADIAPSPAPVLYPAAGCPGPELRVVRSASDTLAHLIFLDTQWLILPDGARPQDRGSVAPSVCPDDTEEGVYEELRRMVNAAGEAPVVLLAHHPVRTYSKHHGAHTIGYWFGFNAQDLNSAPYKRLIDRMESLITSRTSRGLLLYAAGHDHVLQIISDPNPSSYHIVSGAGSKGTSGILERDGSEDLLFAASLSGYMRLDIHGSGDAFLYVYAGCSEPMRGEGEHEANCGTVIDGRFEPEFGLVHSMRLAR